MKYARKANGQFQIKHLYLKAAAIAVFVTTILVLLVLATIGGSAEQPVQSSQPETITTHATTFGHLTVSKGGGE